VLQVRIGNAHYYCFCVRYVTSGNLTLRLIISLSVGIGVPLIIVSVIVVIFFARRKSQSKSVDTDEVELNTLGKQEPPHYSRTLPDDYHR